MLTKEEIIKKILSHKREIRAFGVTKLTLVGSYAQDTAKIDSDIDLLVDFNDGRGLFDDYTNLLHFLQGLLHKDIDLIKPSLIREELREGILGGERVEAVI